MEYDWVKTWWPIVWAGVLSVVQIIQILLSKTYAKREDVEQVKRNMDELKAQVDALPTRDEITKLTLELSEARGEMKELRAQIQPVEHLAQLLLEQRLNDDK
ncbi:DUF2730 family protein [Vibrio parahaemolyticus]|jgi:multidrug resistance efflux pump|uniref:DUF2730 family protein n=1 Tax=Vibrio parahaemolyticus TaxID=670 RepID=UPI0010AB029C|nr:DUF2730 family protein [Vibrio parahaemolyticus]VVH20942.1 hypothetical protein VP3212_27 [Vibrio phage vB_VpaM_VP-3212]EKK9971178.1 DUF2730 family protein [Vibrio parahaemolyticus]MBE3911554.1 DUF2730 family protein [Vibrio parahaemolyticus]MDF5541556.1 DUF2730 family protein [Vibrio parahaemolyticus]THE61015.1 DUF2730 family protein [Vibrio parahaemolyticus]